MYQPGLWFPGRLRRHLCPGIRGVWVVEGRTDSAEECRCSPTSSSPRAQKEAHEVQWKTKQKLNYKLLCDPDSVLIKK